MKKNMKRYLKENQKSLVLVYVMKKWDYGTINLSIYQ